MLSIDLVNALFHHTRAKERTIGINFDSELVLALYGVFEDLTLEDIAKKNLKVELVLELEKIQELIQVAKKNDVDLDNIMLIAKLSELAIAMMEMLNG